MDREIPQHEIKRKKAWRWLKLMLISVFLIIAVLMLRAFISPSVDRHRILVSTAEIGDVEASISASGVVVPEYEQVITAPVQTTVQELRHHSGDTVQAGEAIVALDISALTFRAGKLRDELNYHLNQKRQMQLSLERRTIDLEAALDIKRLEAEFKNTQLERTRKLHELGGATQEQVAQAALDKEIADRQLDQAKLSIENEKEALQTEIEGLDLTIRMKENEISEAERDLTLAGARADRDGVVTWVNDNLGAHVAAGEAVARVADLTRYKVEGQVSDIHVDKLCVGGPAVIRIGNKESIPGIITAVRPSVEGGLVRFDVVPEQPHHPSLRPNLRTDLYVITSYKKGVIRVKNGSFYHGRVDQKLFVIEGDRAVRHSVDIGVSNYDWVELIGDIKPGQEVIVSDMSEYEQNESIRIND
ncbi:MAG TPA: efflux RND transporter periplasmic adaptor subunit [candidate division Zixibacteria bacterium]|nr:efflux RND transporter periplasmic adaptor subunit [candidate division Zixibacteria bacterium]